MTVVIPVFNEAENVRLLLTKLDAALTGIRWEAVFVDDDSPDGTAEIVRDVARQRADVRVIQRIGRRGLSTAVIEGMLSTSSPFLAVIDGDMQHDERVLPDMLSAVRGGDYDIAVGSRYVEGGGFGDWAESRQTVSKVATMLGTHILKADLSDPMSGFFLISREAFTASVRDTSGIGFKILLDLVASSPRPMRVKEVAYEFRTRELGESKLDSAAMWEYVTLLLDKWIGHIVPIRFVMFASVGGLGLVVHLAILGTLVEAADTGFVTGQIVATLSAMIFNYALNNVFTYRDQRLTGWGLLRGLFSFILICSVGAAANVGVAAYIYEAPSAWWIAGIAGAMVGAVWNYAVSSVFTWKKK
ncbi:MAG: glycosyltransferase family 2 protein [Pacificimonas sp.]